MVVPTKEQLRQLLSDNFEDDGELMSSLLLDTASHEKEHAVEENIEQDLQRIQDDLQERLEQDKADQTASKTLEKLRSDLSQLKEDVKQLNDLQQILDSSIARKEAILQKREFGDDENDLDGNKARPVTQRRHRVGSNFLWLEKMLHVIFASKLFALLGGFSVPVGFAIVVISFYGFLAIIEQLV